MADFELFKQFGIDNGELDDIPKHECFVLGYELAQIDHLLELPAAFEKPVHAHNQARIVEACDEADRGFTLDWMKEDPSEEWMWLSVSAKPAEDE